jgi:hypothetical protein
MPVPETVVNNFGQFVDALGIVVGNPKKTVWFRGHACLTWRLLPSLMRPPHTLAEEIVYIKRFKQHSYPFLEHAPESEWEWLFLMQHYTVPTRLLDWSESPLVGLYFALLEPSRPRDRNQDAIVWCLYPLELNKVANLVLDPPHAIPAFGDETVLNGYLPSQAIGVQQANGLPLAILAPRQFKRVYAQQGVFTLFHRNVQAIEDLAAPAPLHIHKIRIPAARKPAMRVAMSNLMIDELSLFPEMEKVHGRVCKD